MARHSHRHLNHRSDRALHRCVELLGVRGRKEPDNSLALCIRPVVVVLFEHRRRVAGQFRHYMCRPLLRLKLKHKSLKDGEPTPQRRESVEPQQCGIGVRKQNPVICPIPQPVSKRSKRIKVYPESRPGWYCPGGARHTRPGVPRCLRLYARPTKRDLGRHPHVERGRNAPKVTMAQAYMRGHQSLQLTLRNVRHCSHRFVRFRGFAPHTR